MSVDFVKHLVQCKCILSIFKKMENPPIHKFVVFSEIDESGNIEPSFAQCTNCDLIHKVKEVGVSEILKKRGSYPMVSTSLNFLNSNSKLFTC